jgi:hypothetical protein
LAELRERKLVHYTILVYRAENDQPSGNPVIPPSRIHERISWFRRTHAATAAIEGSPQAVAALQPGTVYALRMRYNSSKRDKPKKLRWPKFNFHAVPVHDNGKIIGYRVVRCK